MNPGPVLVLSAAGPDAAASQPFGSAAVCSSRINTTHCPQLRERCRLLLLAAVLVFTLLPFTGIGSESLARKSGVQGTALSCLSNDVGQNRAPELLWLLFAASGVGSTCAGVLAAAATRLVRTE
jgi:hypothetical protein